MKLYMVPLAPNPTKIMLYLKERELAGNPLPVEQIVVNTVKGRHKEPEHLARNPFGTVPTLELDDGTFIKESLAILEYFEDAYPEGNFQAATAEARAHARDVERIVDVRLAGAMGAFGHAVNSPLGYPKNPEQAEKCLAAMQAPLDYLEAGLTTAGPWLTGEALALADFTLAVSLQFVRFVEADVLGDRPALRAWDEAFRARPASQAVLRW